MRKDTFIENGYYYLKCSGFDGKNIFADDADKARILFLILHMQSPIKINNMTWYSNSFLRKGEFRISQKIKNSVIKSRYIELLSFFIDNNSLHLIIRNLEEGVASVYMHRTLTSYSKYFNSKYKNKGRVFSGPFRSKHIRNKTDLLNTSLEIHSLTPSPTNEGSVYSWSSLKDHIEKNRWGEFLNTDLILPQSKNQSSYRDFVNSYSKK